MSSVRSDFMRDLDEIGEAVLRMGDFVSTMLDDALRALLEQDAALAQDVRQRDSVADEMDEAIETDSTRLLALQQPMAGDLRRLTAALKLVTDLERIGDYAVAVARTAITLSKEPYFRPLEDIGRMARMAQEIVSQALASFRARDAELAIEVRRSDKAIDELWHSLELQIIEWMKEEPRVVDQASRLLLVARYLERIGDHAQNICERVLYMETGHRKPKYRKAALAEEEGRRA